MYLEKEYVTITRFILLGMYVLKKCMVKKDGGYFLSN